MPKKPLNMLTESMFYVLMALSAGAKCGTEIALYTKERSKGQVVIGPATLYTILGRFEEADLIREIAVDGRKRTYEITGEGKQSYYAEIDRLKRCLRDAVDDREENLHQSAQEGD